MFQSRCPLFIGITTASRILDPFLNTTEEGSDLEKSGDLDYEVTLCYFEVYLHQDVNVSWEVNGHLIYGFNFSSEGNRPTGRTLVPLPQD